MVESSLRAEAEAFLLLSTSAAAYDLNGALDPSFDQDGKVTIDFGGEDTASDIVVQTDGKIIVVGATVSTDTDQDFALPRLNTDGSLDTQGLDPHVDAPFGTAGKVVTDFDGEEDQATSVVLEPNGNILVAGPVSRPELGVDSDFGLARYRIDGSLDPSFGVGGKVTTAFTADEDSPDDLGIQRDGRIVVAGTVWNTPTHPRSPTSRSRATSQAPAAPLAVRRLEGRRIQAQARFHSSASRATSSS